MTASQRTNETVSFESLEPGDEMPPTVISLDGAWVATHAREIDMNAPRFTDNEGAKKEGLPGQIAPGNLTMALLGRALLEWLPGARLRRLGTTFRALALAGGSAHLFGTITEKDEERRTIECDLWMESDAGDRTVVGTATLELPDPA